MSRLYPERHEIPDDAQFVYVVTSGEYSDYQIHGVFSTEELAQDYIDLCRTAGIWRYEDSDIEEWPLNTLKAQTRYRAWVRLESGEHHGAVETTTSADGGELPGHVMENVYAGNPGKRTDIVCGMGASPDAAIKSALDHRAKILAEREGIS
ncbi:MAG: hypothetical protein CVV27_08445 [Candidatus Melainabacteria bacterium HGW-Melainabacteria-1]|nr:MAG: hypothetical protein CVV27_08445 [Candidatus Melainabacteria bacterium HGW-Melainabacteria-1]